MNLLELRNSSRAKADEQTTEFISDAELDTYINQGNRYVFSKICARDSEFFLVKGTTVNGGQFDTVIQQSSYTLPTTFLKLFKVEVRQNGSTTDDDWTRVDKVSMSNDYPMPYYPSIAGYAPWYGYFLDSQNINFRPVPKDVYQIRLWFIPKCPIMTTPTDEPVVPEQYQDLISEFAAIQCLSKSGEPIFLERRTVFESQLENMLSGIGHRDQMAEQMVITDPLDGNVYQGSYY